MYFLFLWGKKKMVHLQIRELLQKGELYNSAYIQCLVDKLNVVIC